MTEHHRLAVAVPYRATVVPKGARLPRTEAFRAYVPVEFEVVADPDVAVVCRNRFDRSSTYHGHAGTLWHALTSGWQEGSAPMKAEEALEWVGLGDRLDHFPSQLSGGEQQRVAIARAIVKRPEVLLCDEPTGALDYETGKLVLEVIARINTDLGTTALVITHNAAISAMADRVLKLGNGRIIGESRPERKLSPSEISW